MPRKKTIQPPPIETFTLEDGTIVEIRGEGCFEIGRGLHNRDAYWARHDKVLERVANDYLTANGQRSVPTARNYLLSGKRFARKVEEWGLHEADDSSLRKRLYTDIKQHIRALANAIKNKSPRYVLRPTSR